ncbi:PREDICTED: glycine cleavage system H protein 2, mitochondrial-like [Tarenaya hassleriana]|uniref:glycine cleavage system H protein 2, mitochondrial-like n=1 Tax=Tarenaya hassleriana TaxID=28532 RepID=UPI00053C5D41|nr:PREDICTED: glycine cleavage system H protein 2, mitochondrial-like [Tarenaya hassleriana]XP_010536594.1 PREDICTED: glycine cleavage system H protein 2, mitochondrial-like [Tarenaya hassleriana]XP_010536602.1 PREDICTED: glycine cleavage system H protein 2, mitochondrial-like [Tarenaya hassleriana]XP_010536609.1 PREDICTED: glycine cleavage system H protein 2, mitochondrial-like [Tarenaya hassleriana]XP_010536619.1 PREDICTED: glycine cleavage system H protein 2, mitochondrial-like [Tarenaya has
MALPLFWASRTASRLRISVLRRRSFGSVNLRDLKYAGTHEWVKVDGNAATIGITHHAQDHVGDVIFVELPELGRVLKQGCSFASVESMKATSDVNSPVSGKVIKVHEELTSSPGLVNWSPYERGWMVKVEMSDRGELNNLMDSDQYTRFCEEEADSKH